MKFDVTTPADKGGRRWSGWQRAGVGVLVLGGLAAVAMMPAIWDAGPVQQEAEKREPGTAEKFRHWELPDREEQQAGVQSTGATGNNAAPAGQRGAQGGQTRTAARVTGGEQAPARRRPPPPINISTHSGDTAGDGGQRASGGARGGGEAAPAPQALPQQQARGQGGEPSSTSLSGQLEGGVELAATKAGFMPHPDYMILAGTQIPCLPVETYNSAMGGFVTCRVPEWVRDDTMRRGLLPPGTVVKGQIRGGMAQGQPRLGVLYREIVTSGDRFKIRLSGLGSDAQGRSGLDADINTFFWETAGAVALYGLIQGTTNAIPLALQAALQSGSNNNYSQFGYGFGGQGGGQGLANRLLQDRLNRQPEAERDWALPMFVTVGQDLDFHDACRQRRRFNQMACPEM